jgi:hypothetical protein
MRSDTNIPEKKSDLGIHWWIKTSLEGELANVDRKRPKVMQGPFDPSSV